MASLAEQSAKGAPPLPELPKGCVRGVAPDGTTPIIVRAPRGPGPWFRVKHRDYGHRLVKAETADEAVQKFAEEFCAHEAGNKKWLDQFRPQCRVQRLPEQTEQPKA